MRSGTGKERKRCGGAGLVLPGFHPAWSVCTGCAVLLFCTTGLTANANAAYQPYIRLLNGFTNTQTSTLMTVRNLSSFAAVFLIGWYYRIFSLRNGLTLAGIFTAASLALFGCAHSYPAYCAAAFLSGIGFGFGSPVPIVLLMERWFRRKRTLAISLCHASTGIATLGIPSLIAWCVERFGLSAAYFGECTLVCILVAFGFLLVRDRPDGIHTQPYGAGSGLEAARSSAGRAGISGRDWLLLVPALLMIGGLTSVGYGHQTMLAASNGFSERTGALMVTASGILLMIGKAFYGVLSERITCFRANLVFGTVLITALALFSFPIRSAAVLLIASALYGMGLSMTAVGVSVWAGDLSPEEDCDRNVRRFQICYSAGCLVFASVPGMLADAAGGSYLPAYRLFLAFAVLSMLIIQSRYRALREREKEGIRSVPGSTGGG